MILSIVVLAYNRPELTKQTLDSLIATTKDIPVPHEIIVVDNESDTETQEIIQNYQDHLKIIRIDKNIGVGAGKNRGIEQTTGKYLYISDNDLYYLPGWVDKLVAAHVSFPEVKVIGGFRHHFHGLKKEVEKNGLKLELSDQQVGSSWFLSRETWDKFGPLKEGGFIGEDDAIFNHRIRETGAWVGAISPPVVVHCGLTNSEGQKTPGWQHQEELAKKYDIITQ